MAMFNQTNKMDPIEIFKWFQERKASAATPEGRKNNALGSKPGDVGTGELSPVEDYFASLWEKTQQSVEATRKELAPTMEEAARRSAEEAATLRSKMGITDSDFSFGSKITEMQKRKQNISMLKEPEAYEAEDEDVGIPAQLPIAEGKGLMAPPETSPMPEGDLSWSEERDLMTDPYKKGGAVMRSVKDKDVTTDGKVDMFKVQELIVSSVGKNRHAAALLGAIKTEVGTGIKDESPYYSLGRAKEVWLDEDVDGVLATLPAQTQARLKSNKSTKADRKALGEAMFDKKYNGGKKYKGRGLIQITHEDNYEAVGKRLGLDLVKNPELVNDPRYAVPAAIAYMDHKGYFDLPEDQVTKDKLQALINPKAPSEIKDERWKNTDEYMSILFGSSAPMSARLPKPKPLVSAPLPKTRPTKEED